MIAAALAVLIFAAQGEASFSEDAAPATPESTRQEALAKFASCGITAAQLRIESDEYNGGYAAFITVAADDLAMPAYVCLARAEMEKGAQVNFDDTDATQLFWRAHDEANREGARDRMREIDLLDKVPRYDPARQSLADFARALEKLCGVAPGKGFTVAGPESLTLPDAMALGVEPPSPCLLDAAGASNLHEHGVTVSLEAPAAE